MRIERDDSTVVVEVDGVDITHLVDVDAVPLATIHVDTECMEVDPELGPDAMRWTPEGGAE